MRKILHIFLSLVIVYASTQSAFAASAWSITSAVSAGARTVVTATKSGYKSAVNIAPTAGRLALKLAKLGRSTALVYAVGQLIDAVDWVLDPANNRVVYRQKSDIPRYTFDGVKFYTASEIAQYHADYCADAVVDSLVLSEASGTFVMKCKYKTSKNGYLDYPVTEKYLSMPQIANQVLKNAEGGHAASQSVTKDTAVEMVIGGQFDQDLLQGAVPTTDTKPLVPAVPISGNGNVTHGESWEGGDDGMSGATPGEQADAAKAAADAAKTAAQAAADAAKAAAEDAAKAADDAQDLINSGADQAAIDAANQRAAAAEKAAADAKASADAAKAAADARAQAAEAAAAAAKADADARAQAAQAAADAAVAAAKAAAEADKAAAQAAADAAVAAAKAAKAEAEARAKAAEDARRAADKAAAEASKFELPAFCSWAKPVCDAIDWIKKDPSDVSPTPVDVSESSPTKSADEFDVNYIGFSSQCPVLQPFAISIGAVSTSMSFDMTPLCNLAVSIRPAIISIGYFIGLGVIASAIRES